MTEISDASYKTHIFICTNKKEHKRCCEDHNAHEMVRYAKEQAAILGLTKTRDFRISSSGCMGRCEQGPVLVVYPAGTWHSYSCKEDIDAILQSLIAS
jgi:(2Fe-2S) ferredoxin